MVVTSKDNESSVSSMRWRRKKTLSILSVSPMAGLAVAVRQVKWRSGPNSQINTITMIPSLLSIKGPGNSPLVLTFQYFRPKHKEAKIFENHQNPVMLVFIG